MVKRIITMAGIAMVICAWMLTMYAEDEERNAGRAVMEAAARLETAARQETAGEAAAGEDARDVPEGPAAGAPGKTGREAAPEPDPVAVIDGKRYLGELIVPELSMTLPVLAEWSEGNLKTAPCRYAGSRGGHDLVICGHNYRRHFGPLRSLGEGAEIRFRDAEGRETGYRVAETGILDGADVAGMVTGDWDLTLFTCTSGGGARHVLRCREEQGAGAPTPAGRSGRPSERAR